MSDNTDTRWLTVAEAVEKWFSRKVCEEAISYRGLTDGDDVGFTRILSSSTADEKAVRKRRRDSSQPDQSTHFQTYSSLGFSDVRGYSQNAGKRWGASYLCYGRHYGSQEEDPAVIRAEGMSDISDFFCLGPAQCGLRGVKSHFWRL